MSRPLRAEFALGLAVALCASTAFFMPQLVVALDQRDDARAQVARVKQLCVSAPDGSGTCGAGTFEVAR